MVKKYKTLFKRLSTTLLNRDPQNARRKLGRALRLEHLDRRELLAADLLATFDPHNGLLKIEGTANDDSVYISQANNELTVWGLPIWNISSGDTVDFLTSQQVSRIEFDGLEGDDFFHFDDAQAGADKIIPALVYGGDGSDTLTTGRGADTIYGGSGDENIAGGPGSDFIFGGPGYDILYGEGGADFIYGEEDADTIFGGDADDVITGGGAWDTMYGENGNDTIYGNDGDDALYGGIGGDKLWGGDGVDHLEGGDGTDSLWGEAGDDWLYGNLGNDTLRGGSGNDYLDGDLGNDKLYGDAGDDELIGGTYSYIQGATDNDILQGGAGADRLSDIYGNDTLDYSESSLGVKIDIVARTSLGGHAAGDIIMGTFENLNGSQGSDILLGSSVRNRIIGNGGDDYLYGFGGNDDLRGGDGSDRILGGTGNDTIEGGNANDFLFGNDGHDTLVGAFINNPWESGNADDWMEGGDGGDWMYGGIGNDTLFGAEPGNVSYVDGFNYLNGESGNDRLFSGTGTNQLIGGDGDDGLVSYGQSAELIGGQDQDRFVLFSGSFNVVNDKTAEDVSINMINSTAVVDRTMGGFGQELFSFDAGMWTAAEIQNIDNAFNNLHHLTGNTRLLKKVDGSEMTISRLGNQTRGSAFIGGWNQVADNTIVVTNNGAVDSNTVLQTIYHEFGHNWDQAAENPFIEGAGGFHSLSEWIQADERPTTHHTGSTVAGPDGLDDNWWHSIFADFARSYGRQNPLEDYATTWETYFMNKFHGTTMSNTVVASKIANLDRLFAFLA
ncbi:MAG: calcium-binding protein [Pirellulaceae bacterium]